MARQLRDAQCHTIWEGTENILCIDVRRAMRGEQAHLALFGRVEQALDAGSGHKVLAGALDTVAGVAGRRPGGDRRTSRRAPDDMALLHSRRFAELLADTVGGRAAGGGGGVGARPRRRRPQGGRGPALRRAGGCATPAVARHHRPRPHRCSTCSSRSSATGRSRSPTSPPDRSAARHRRRRGVTTWGRSRRWPRAALSKGSARLVDAAHDLGHPVEPAPQDAVDPALEGGRRDGARAARPLELDLDQRPTSTSKATSSRSPPSLCTAGRMSSISDRSSASRWARTSSLTPTARRWRGPRRIALVGSRSLRVADVGHPSIVPCPGPHRAMRAPAPPPCTDGSRAPHLTDRHNWRRIP